MIIHLFGATTPSGKAFKKLIKAEGYKNIFEYTRKNLGNEYKFCDMKRPNEFKFFEDNKNSIIISFAPIWIVSKFLFEISNLKPQSLKNIQRILICSSSSVITKKYSFNLFDQKLSRNLEQAEDTLIELSKSCKIDLKIIRPTMVYGSFGGFEDKNFSKIIKFMRISPLLILPKNSGYRQPISCFELANVFVSLLKDKNKIPYSKILIGGDRILKFNAMLISLQKSTKKNDQAKNCFFLYLPDKVFILLIFPVVILSRKKYESLLRIFANLSNFTSQNEITNKESKFFPNNDF